MRIYTVPLAYTLTYDTRIIRDHIRRYDMHIRIPSSCEYEYCREIATDAKTSDFIDIELRTFNNTDLAHVILMYNYK